ncbi:MAG TPA: AmmeMemoRadiSam system radical SAM enzyme [Candidatus Cloacimonetes bacterium]|nr:AmmeMemoRadiSam system radical SAM enzyme [Candidatus Cloacimonadota bacterium]HEX37519.1 AmmeMemoRadiSam system radical SAM enzyme [Candidatus Cloacimonadota bacterium]
MRKLTEITILISLAFLLIASSNDVKSPREAEFYEKLDNDAVRCVLCPNRCVLPEGATGICRVRQNINGTLYSLVYNKPVSINIDPIEKKPLYHFYPGTTILSLATVGCNMRCNFCQNWTISQSNPDEVRSYEVTPEQIIEMAKEYNCKSIAFTYTEPTVFYEYMIDIAKCAHKNDIKTVWVTCGYINEEPLRELISYLDAANIDLKGYSEDFYSTYTTGSLAPVLRTIEICKEEGLYFEITNLVIPDANDDPEMISDMCEWLKEYIGTEHPLHFSRFSPQFKLTNRPPTPVKTLEMAYDIAKDVGMKYVYLGNIISASEDTYCPHCGKKIIDRYGFTVQEMHITDGKCDFCDYKIFGEFE